ncbi:MAG TPA: hypothetical protein VJ623_07365 [Holophagaceae bacterium]|nr:hypothetical protein [Holophagaceae bacterium]
MRLYSATEALDHELPGGPSAGGDPTPPLASNFANFWERRGRRVFECQGVLWGHHKGPFYTSFPQHLRIDATPDELREVFRMGGVQGLRFPSTGRPGMPNGMYVMRPQGYTLKTVNQRQRSHVKRGLEACEIRAMAPDELAALGLALNEDTLARQDRSDADFLDPARWKHFCKAIGDTPAMSIHGAFVEGQLASYLVSCREGDWVHMIYGMSRTHLREYYPNHALDFIFITGLSEDPTVRYISNGGTSTLPNEGLDRFKRQMGYQISEQNLCLHFHPLMSGLLTSRAVAAVTEGLEALLPHQESLAYRARILEGARLTLG